MKRLMIIGAGLASTVVLAACGSGGSTGAGGSNASTKTVSVEQAGGAGSVLVDSSGHALYASDQETHGKVLCTGACNAFWRPLTVGGTPMGGSLSGRLEVIKRPDGKKQVSYKGELLYSFSEDGSGEVGGDGLKDAFGGQQFTWHVVRADGATSSQANRAASTGNSPGY